ncbi:MAG: NAD(P)-binding protein, partial [Raoultibacter sp.]
MKRVIVVGAGVGGLAAAIRLQHAGYEVELYEKEPRVGGKMNQIQGDGFSFDVGPTIVMMPSQYRELFELCGKNPDD